MKVNRKELISILKRLRGGLSSQSSSKDSAIEAFDQSTHFVFTGENVLTHNNEICIVFPYKTPRPFSVPANQFFNILSRIGDETIVLKYDEDRILIRSEKIKSEIIMSSSIDEFMSNIKSIKADEFNDKKQQALPCDFKNGLELCAFSVLKDVSKDLTYGALTSFNVSGSSIMSCDSIRASKFEMAEAIDEPFLLPGKAGKLLCEFDPIKYYVLDGWVYFMNQDGAVFCSRTIDAEFPEVDEFFDIKGKEIPLPTKEIIDGIITASIMSDTGGGDADDITVNISISDGVLKCIGKNEKGKIEFAVESESFNNHEINFSANPTFLQQVLKIINVMTVGDGRLLFKNNQFEHVLCTIATTEE